MKQFMKGLLLAALMLCPQSIWAIGNNEIHYTTENGCKIMLNENIAMGATIISNTYENGQGVITFSQDVTALEESAFEGCKTLTSIELPKSIVKMGAATFAGCDALNKIEINGNVTTVGDFAFYGCSSLEHLTLQNNAAHFGMSAFEGCICLSNVEIANPDKSEYLSLNSLK